MNTYRSNTIDDSLIGLDYENIEVLLDGLSEIYDDLTDEEVNKILNFVSEDVSLNEEKQIRTNTNKLNWLNQVKNRIFLLNKIPRSLDQE